MERLKNFLESAFIEEIAWKIFVKTFFFFFFGDRLKNFCEDLFFFFLESTCALCPWSLALASSIPVLGLESVCPRKGCPWPWPWRRIFFVSLALALASSLVSSTPPLFARSISASLRLRATKLLSQKCCRSGEPLSTLCQIWPSWNENLPPPSEKTNALPLDQLDLIFDLINNLTFKIRFGFGSTKWDVKFSQSFLGKHTWIQFKISPMQKG